MNNNAKLDQLIDLSCSQNYWVTQQSKLSRALKKRFPDWNMSLYYADKCYHQIAEKRLLNLEDEQPCYARIITHNIGDEPVIVGLVLMDLQTYQHYQCQLDNMNNDSIGETFLFRSKFQRTPFDINQHYSNEVQCFSFLPEDVKSYIPDQVLSRSSLFTYKHFKVLIVEYFLKDL